MLALLTMIGVSASMSSSVEVRIAGNEMIYKQNLYMAEASVMESTQRLENGGTEMKDLAGSNCPIWLLDLSSLPAPNDITDPSNWTDTYSQVSIDSSSRFLTVFQGIATGSSLDMSTSRLYSYRVFGRSTQSNGLSTVEMGYTRAF